IEIGMPANGEGAALALRKPSIASAAARAPSASTEIKTRAPSPAGSAILARQASTRSRAVVRPLARSAASEARVGLCGIIERPLIAGGMAKSVDGTMPIFLDLRTNNSQARSEERRVGKEGKSR